MPRKRRAGNGTVDINMTPMIDCAFQLIIFFLLTAQMVNQDLAEVAVPNPHHSIAMSEKDQKVLPNRVIVNIVSQYGDKTKDRNPILSARAVGYQIGMTKIDVGDTERLTNILKDRYANAREQGFKDFFVEVRGDRDIAYRGIEPVLRAAGEAKIAKISITAFVDPNVVKVRK